MNVTSTLDAGTLVAEASAKRRTFLRYFKEGPQPRLQVGNGRQAGGRAQITIIIPTADGTRHGNLAHLLAQIGQ